MERSEVLGVGISPMTFQQAVDRAFDAVARPGFAGYVTVTGVHGVMESQDDPELLRIHNDAYMVTPDGMPMVWMAWANGYPATERVYGPDLMLAVMNRSVSERSKHFLFGGSDGVVDQLADCLRRDVGDVRVVGKVTPPFRLLTDEEEQQLVADLQREQPHFLWVGLSTPKQERFMASFLAKYPDLTARWDHGLLLFGVGAAFDFHAGLVKQAPSWMQECGLEWFFRLCVEPRRLWKRYMKNNPRFVWKVLRRKLG
ncbi:WecB/TagA/CpsF family glycosyltransferase [Sulfuriroseicoccus oceanibius]|uniref:WecB/TagA/CpsF family glycosyltransferase n=1 Tax=Sulfuriroseicoccus oceanibius TaxID=2707525 RepID=A0A6B3L709_9BACT|nr:WecB/TagA/CpsF family glycosyltransferase [Sulfuriroseicoccus oceanibius]QQL45620.1 WecB/TagA/CpsF family glycosyltransferase [Sulfuriroseicoccus oceanibius]